MNTARAQSAAGHFAQGAAAGGDWRAAIRKVGDALAAQGAAGALGLIYVTEPWAEHLPDMAATLKQRLGVAQWAGCASFGIFMPGQEVQRDPAVTAMVAPFAADDVAVLPGLLDEASARTTATTPWCRMNAPVFGIIHADPRNAQLDAMIGALMDDDVGGGYVVGGLTPAAHQPMQMADGAVTGGLSGVLLSSRVAVAVTLSQGCTPLGPVHKVTAGRRGVIAELNGKPALDVLKDNVGEMLARDLRRIAGYIHVALPVSDSDVRDYAVRNLMGIDPKSGLIAVGADLNPGDTLMFVRRDPASAQADFNRALEDLKKRIGNRRILGGHYVSCVARGAQMFGHVGAEAQMITRVLGEFPLVGFFANGEISGRRLYGYTGVLSVFLDQAL
ncbi:MAG: FIST C-terminal domain-containing protein [Rhodospirillaceae bacterium]|nr:FIST C-terminal domain-containing protein [Rhodospirillaceae bacterium]